MSTATILDGDPTGHNPPRQIKSPRRRWHRRIGLTLLGLLLLAAVAHAVWGWRAKRQFMQRLAELNSAGEPVYAADFAPPSIPDSNNAAIDLLATEPLIDRDDPAWEQFTDIPLRLPWDQDELTRVRQVVTAKAEVLALASSSARKGDATWKIDPSVPHVFQDLPALAGSRAVANLLARAALLAHVEGRHAQALAMVRDTLAISRAMDRQATIVSHLVSVGIGMLACETANEMLPDLLPAKSRGAGLPAPSVAQVRELIDLLLQDGPSHDGQLAALRRERLAMSQMVTAVAGGDLDLGTARAGGKPPARGKSLGYLMRPLFFDDGRFAIDYFSEVIEAFEHTHRRLDFAARSPPLPERELERHRWRHMLSGIMLPSTAKVVDVHYRGVSDRRLTAVGLAIRCYAAEHGGAMPASLTQLVPQYLPAVPQDPFAPAGTPLSFRGGGAGTTGPAAGPIVYSIGEDAKNDQGSDGVVKPHPSWGDEPSRWHRKDAVLHLTRQPRPPKPKPEQEDGMVPGSVFDQPQPAANANGHFTRSSLAALS